jgi:putative DNA primase/helicase
MRERIRMPITDADAIETRMILNVRNGWIDLSTGELKDRQTSPIITKYIDVDYDPNATCPFWDKTLALAFDGDQELINYMRRAIGYTLTGSTSEQCLFICWGEQGNNGKSTILETLQNLLGPYAQMSDMKVITSQDMDNRVASSLAKLPGVRLVAMNEAEEHQKLSEALVKQITGGDALQACKKFKEPFEFLPVFKLWVRTNEKPIIRGMTDAIWRRIKLIPFEKPIPPEARLRRDEVDEALRSEYAGILAWAIRGAREWHLGGLQDPEIVKASTSDYRSEMDLVVTFLDECTEDKPASEVNKNEMYQVFVHWCRDNGVRFIMNSANFNKRIRRIKGVDLQKKRGSYVWPGIGLNEFSRNTLIA